MRKECPTCGSSSGYVEYQLSSWCFRCHKLTWLKREKGYIHPTKATKIFEGLPMSSTYALPATAIAWLKKYHVTDEQIDLYKFMYVKELDTGGRTYHDRLIIPSYNKEGVLKFFQGRALSSKDDTKYVSSGNMSYMFWSKQADTRLLCIVEDAISAVRVGEVMSCVSLGGTSVNEEKLGRLLEEKRPLVVWLDGDKPGQNASRKLITRLSNLAIGGIQAVYSQKDPKTYSTEQLKALYKELRTTKDQYVFRI